MNTPKTHGSYDARPFFTCRTMSDHVAAASAAPVADAKAHKDKKDKKPKAAAPAVSDEVCCATRARDDDEFVNCASFLSAEFLILMQRDARRELAVSNVPSQLQPPPSYIAERIQLFDKLYAEYQAQLASLHCIG